MKENSIGDRIEEKYTRYINCETDILELTIEEAIFILEKNASVHYVEDLLQKAYKVILLDYKRVLKENEKLNNRCRNLDKEAQGYLEELVGDDTLSTRTMKQLQKENEELKEINEQLSENKLLQDIEIKKNFIPIQKVKDKIEYLDNQQKQWLEDRKLKESDREIIFARDILQELLGKE